MTTSKPVLWAVALAMLGLAGPVRWARAQEGCYNETCATSSETLSVCNGGCVITVPTYGSYGTYNEDYVSKCVQCGSCSGILNWTYDGYCYEGAPTMHGTVALSTRVYVWVRGCDGNYSVVSLDVRV
jgi:hypothetical protein